jgi:hypothetical protein
MRTGSERMQIRSQDGAALIPSRSSAHRKWRKYAEQKGVLFCVFFLKKNLRSILRFDLPLELASSRLVSFHLVNALQSRVEERVRFARSLFVGLRFGLTLSLAAAKNKKKNINTHTHTHTHTHGISFNMCS